MNTRLITSIEEAEATWAEAFTAETTEDMRVLLHPEFVAVHSPVGHIHNAEEFIADSNARPRPTRLQVLTPTVRDFGATATVSCIQQFDVNFVPGVPPFVIQAAVTRVWVRHDQQWLLAHLQMARRMPPA
ncbi:nuclear transport factor 2 family protein [Mycobacterium sp. 1245852.3]|uniref:nuclear transport factor 2 family protein n=1 Tax=Mycobacterium sp. 1245852.3 TaxID=1856860 RepID=UPI000801FDBE|nr:nuclear transport factor 2 family protein [Mycobacterium sp. 1245852.3]OBJ99956.1 hypothetical protein A9W96_18135 [Mycobacterium sp. 1245852.3]